MPQFHVIDIPKTVEELEEEFEVYGANISEDAKLKQKCLDFCQDYEISAEQMAVLWMAFSASNGFVEISQDNIDSFEKEIVRDKKSRDKLKHNPSEAKVKHEAMLCEDDELLAAYNSSIARKKPENGATFQSPIGKNERHSRNSFSSPSLVPSLSQSPHGQKSQKYTDRKNSGFVVCSYGACEDNTWNSSSQISEVSQIPCDEQNEFKSPYKFMFDKPRTIAEVADDAIFSFGDMLKKQFGIEEFADLRPSNNNVSAWYLGRVCCDGAGRLNAFSVMLEGDREISNAEMSHLDLSKLKSYSIFPGQIILVKGLMSNSRLVAEEIIDGFVLPPPKIEFSSSENLEGNQIRIACGPFTTRSNLLYEPLQDLLKEISENPPQVLILLGPILDISHPALLDECLDDTYDSITSRILENIASVVNGFLTKVYIVASTNEASGIPIYPTPPVLNNSSVFGKISVLPDPCILKVDGIAVGLTTVDFPMQMSRQEINFGIESKERLGILSKHCLLQQTFYPIYPPPEAFNVNVQKLDIYSGLPFTPHIMVTPSDLKGYIKKVSDCLFINTERLTKGEIGGSFCRIQIQWKNDRNPVINAQVVKI